jgi:hypothetical protein
VVQIVFGNENVKHLLGLQIANGALPPAACRRRKSEPARDLSELTSAILKSSRSSHPEDARRKEKTFRPQLLFSIDRSGLLNN